MAGPYDTQRDGDIVLHQEAIEQLIDERTGQRINAAAGIGTVAHAAGANPTAAEYNTLVDEFNALVTAMKGE